MQSQKTADEKMLIEPTLYSNVQNWAGDLISGNTTTGRFLVVFAFVCSLAALAVYIWGKKERKTHYCLICLICMYFIEYRISISFHEEAVPGVSVFQKVVTPSS